MSHAGTLEGHAPAADRTHAIDKVVLTGLLGEYDSDTAVVAAARRVRDAGYTRWDVHTPYPVHGIDAAMGIRPTKLPVLVFLLAATGTSGFGCAAAACCGCSGCCARSESVAAKSAAIAAVTMRDALIVSPVSSRRMPLVPTRVERCLRSYRRECGPSTSPRRSRT